MSNLKQLLKTALFAPLALAPALGLESQPAHAEVYTFIVEKQEAKANHRWSLAEWIETRDRMRLMDLWLALHSPSPFEFYVGGDYVLSRSSPTQPFDKTGFRIQVAAYASIFGLEGEFEPKPLQTKHLTFNVRLLGFYVQATNLTLQTGVRFQKETNHYRNFFVGPSLTIYIARFFGITGIYRYYFDSTPASGADNGVSWTGSVLSQRVEFGPFLDFKFLRLYGSYFYQPSKRNILGSSDPSQIGATESWADNGLIFGTRLFF